MQSKKSKKQAKALVVVEQAKFVPNATMVASQPTKKKRTRRNKTGRPKTAMSGGINITTPFGGGSISWADPPGLVSEVDKVTRRPSLRTIKDDKGEICEELTGCDAVCQLSVGATAINMGDVLCDQAISPYLFPDSRIAQLAPLWERFRFTQLFFDYCPTATTFNAGQILGFYEPDSEKEWISDPKNYNEASAYQGARPTQISMRRNWEVSNPSFTNMFTAQEGDPRLQQQGHFLLIAGSALPANSPLGNLFVHYRVLLYSPAYTPADSVRIMQLSPGVTLTPANYLGSNGGIPYPNVVNNLNIVTKCSATDTTHTFTELTPGGSLLYYVQMRGSGLSDGGSLAYAGCTLDSTTAVTVSNSGNTSIVLYRSFSITQPNVALIYTAYTSATISTSQAKFVYVPPKLITTKDAELNLMEELKELRDQLRGLIAEQQHEPLAELRQISSMGEMKTYRSDKSHSRDEKCYSPRRSTLVLRGE